MKKGLLATALLLLASCEEVHPPAPPQFSEIHLSEIGPNSARITAEVQQIGDTPIEDHGFVLAEDSAFTDIASGNKLGGIARSTPVPIPMSRVAAGLKPNTQYFTAAYALINESPVFSKIKSFKTSNILQPGIRSDAADNINALSARIKGTLLSAGTHPISEYGLVYASTENPSTALTTKYRVASNVSSFPLAFNHTAANLSPATTYHFRAYVISNGVTTYGQNLSFRTTAVSQPGVQTGEASDIGTSTATLHGKLNHAGTFPITERGIVWGTAANPTTSNFKGSYAGNVANFPHDYSVGANNLSMNTTYNYRAYVISNGVTTYGENKTFRTSNQVLPGVRTDDAKIGSSNGTIWGTLTSKGSHPISEYGLVWGTEANPTTAQQKKTYGGDVTTFPKQFDAFMENLRPATTYYYRAYVTMNGATAYGENKTFSTGIDLPQMNTQTATNISVTSATVNASVTSPGSFGLTEIGIVWGNTNTPTTANNKQTKSPAGIGFPHAYSFDLSGLTQNTLYYYRPYVISNGQVYYGTTFSFRTASFRAITVSTSSTRNSVTNQGYRLFGTAISGTNRIVRYGFYHNNAGGSDFNFLASKEVSFTSATPLSGTINYNLIIPFYGCGNTIKYRAYAVDEKGNWVYGNVITFSTSGCVN